MKLRVDLNVHGVCVKIFTDSESIADSLKHDFGYFLSTPRDHSDLTMTVSVDEDLPSTWIRYTSIGDCEFFRSAVGSKKIRLFGKAYIEYEFDEGRASIYCWDKEVAYETCYVTLLCFVGEQLDLKGLHRIHGLGFTYRQSGYLVLAPSGTGKSTLALHGLNHHHWRLLSDDTPLICGEGTMFAFPQRIGLKERPSVSEEHLRIFRRVHFGEKFVLGYEYFRDQIVDTSSIDYLVILVAGSHRQQSVTRVSRVHFFWPLLKWLVMGYETPQIWQLFLRLSFYDVQRKARILFSRCHTAYRLLTRTKAFYICYREQSPEETLKLLFDLSFCSEASAKRLLDSLVDQAT